MMSSAAESLFYWGKERGETKVWMNDILIMSHTIDMIIQIYKRARPANKKSKAWTLPWRVLYIFFPIITKDDPPVSRIYNNI